jgi:hypothetical protein
VGHVASEMKKFYYKIFVGKLEGKKPLRRPKCRREDIKVSYGNKEGGGGQNLSSSG